MNFCFVAETEEIFCNFEEHCAFEIDWTATERWTYAVQRRTKWENTLNIGLLSNTPVLVLCTKVTYLHVCVYVCGSFRMFAAVSWRRDSTMLPTVNI